MRITEGIKYSSIQINIQRTANNFYKANEQVATGKKLINSSDDPSAMREVLDMRSLEASADQYLDNMTKANNSLELASTTIDRVDELVTQAWEYAVLGGEPDQRAAAAIGITGIMDEMFSLANTKDDGKYIFSGFSTSTQPFDPADPTYTYNGDTGSIQIAIDDSINVAVNVTGDSLFSGAGGGIDLFTELDNLRTALQTDDETAIQSALTTFQTAHDQVENAAALTAARYSQVGAKMESTENFKNNLLSRISAVEDVDSAKAVVNLTMMQTAYEVALSSSTMLMETNLMNFLA